MLSSCSAVLRPVPSAPCAVAGGGADAGNRCSLADADWPSSELKELLVSELPKLGVEDGSLTVALLCSVKDALPTLAAWHTFADAVLSARPLFAEGVLS